MTGGRRLDAAVALALFALAFAIQLPIFNHWIGYSDEGLVVQGAAEINRGKVMYRDFISPLPGPAAFHLLAGIFRVFGTSHEAARLTMAVMSSAMAALLYVLARGGAAARAPAVLVGLAFLSLRVAAFPHWHFYHYASCAAFFATLSYAVLLVTLGHRRFGLVALAGAIGAVGMLAKQDIGGACLAGLGIATFVLRTGRRVRSAATLAAGALAVLVPVLGYFALRGALPALFEQTVRTAFRGYAEFDYLKEPNLFPLFAQDPVLRARMYDYAPSIVMTLYREAFFGGRLYQTTAFWDTAIKLWFFLPYVVLATSAVVFGAAWLSTPASPAAATRRARATLALVFGTVVLGAFNPPHDWFHLLILYHPTVLLAGLVLDRIAGSLGRRLGSLVLVVGGVVVVGALGVSLSMLRDLRRTYDTPVVTPGGTVHVPSDEATVLQGLFADIARHTGPADPLPVMPYHPMIGFLADRTAGMSNFFFWPVRPRDDTDPRLIADLEASQPRILVYSPSQYVHLRRFRDNFPGLFAYLADHYEIARTYSTPGWGPAFCVLIPETPPPAPLVDLASRLDEATVSVVGRDGERVVGGDERKDAVGRTLWPFRRVVYERPTHDGETRLTFRVPVPPHARLRFGYGIDPDQWVSFTPAAVTFRVAGGGRTLFAATIDPERIVREREWRDMDVDLGELAGEDAVLTFGTSTDGPAGERPDFAGWSDPRVVAMGR